MNVLPAYRTWAIVLLITAGAVVSSAQYKQPNAINPNDGLTVQLVKTGLYVITGQGSNSVLRLSANGQLLVGGKLPGNYDALRARAKKISDQPIRALILTGCDESSTGTNAKFVEHGSHIVVQENAKQNLAACNLSGDAMAPAVITYGNEYQIHLGGIEARMLHFGHAYSNSDTVVYFPNLKVVAIGDLFSAKPVPDFAAGGSLVGWGTVLAQVLKLDFDVAIPSTGPTITRAELEAFKTKMDTLVARATGLVKQGVPEDQLMAQLKAGDLGWQLSFTGDQLDRFYAELSRTN
ncbi:MAG: hypothetical protein WAL85_03655 [Candidatus Korobacteraceae bacterium]